MSFRQDLAYACRTLRGHPLFTLTAVLSVAVGIAGATSVFSVADAMLLRSSPGVASPHRLIEVGRIEPDGDFNTLSYADYVDLRDRNAVLEGLAAVDGGAVFGVGTSAGAISVDGAHVAANYFAVLGVPFTLGRGFADHEERTSTQAAVAVISERIWDRLFNGEMDVVGRTLHLSGRPYSIVGVAGAGFAGTTLTVEDVWLPLAGYSDALMQPDRTPLQAIGRPRPDVTLDVAQAHMQQLARELPRGQAGTDPLRVALVPSDRIPESEQNAVETFIGLLFAMVGLLLLIACTNVAGMLGARGLARKREMAVRVALGAAHGRVVRLLVAESLVIGAAGALAGIGGAFALTQALRGIVPVLPLSISLDFGVDWRVIGFAVALSLIASLVFGLLPAVQAARVDLQSAMKPDRSGGGPRRLRLRQAFVVAQVAVSVLLVVCAVLLARSVSHAAGVDPGFAAENVDLVGINMRLGGYDDGADVVFAEELIAEVERLPGVTAAGTAWIVPLQMRGTSTTVSLPATGTEESRLTTLWNVVSPGYFEALGLPMVRGRAFTERDRAGAPEVAIVSETFAERAWPGEDPIGRSFVNRDRTMQVVGVARDSKYRSIGEAPQPFLPSPQSGAPERARVVDSAKRSERHPRRSCPPAANGSESADTSGHDGR
jgi:predicted permease